MTRWLAQISSYDQRFFCWLSERLGAFSYSKIVRWISRSGDGYWYGFIAVILTLTMSSSSSVANPFAYAQTLLLGFALEIPLFRVLKSWWKRPRPYQKMPDFIAVIEAHDQFSLPSGHTTAAFLFASISYAYFPQYAVVWFAWASLVGCSRVALGVHYPGDIVAGALIGSALGYWSLLCVS
jgi:undecaprenyl-diphosphatase